MSGDIRVVDPTTIDETEPVNGLLERAIFLVDGRRLVLCHILDETALHRRNGTVYGWVRRGIGQVAAGGRQLELEQGDFIRIPSETTRRYTAGHEPLQILAVVDSPKGITEVDTPAPQTEDGTPDVVPPEELVPSVESPDLTRETPFPEGEVLMMRVQAAGGAAAGWHHHGDNVYFGYAVDGPSETEYGPSGEAVARIEMGECFHVPPQLVHRDTNPTDESHHGIIWLCGGEPWVVNVDGPA